MAEFWSAIGGVPVRHWRTDPGARGQAAQTGGRRLVWRMAIGGEPKRWLAIRGLRIGAASLDISPDGRRLVVSLQKPESDLWLVGR